MLMFTLNSNYCVISSLLATVSSLRRVLSALLATCFALVSCLTYTYSSTLMMEVTCSFENLVDFQRATQRYVPEDRTLHNHRCENHKSHTVGSLFYVHTMRSISRTREPIITSSAEKKCWDFKNLF
jgi:hypothetical protein